MDGLNELHKAVAFQFGLVDKRSKELETRLLAEMNRRFDKVDNRFDKVDNRFEEMTTSVDARFDKVDARFDRLEDLIRSEMKRRKR